MSTAAKTSPRLPKTIESRVYQVPIISMRTPPALVTQREFRRGWGDSLAANLDLDRLGLPVLNRRDGVYYVVDGQHRVYALKKSGFEGYDLECRVFENLSDHDMAEMFLVLNNQLPVATFSKFHVCVTAERPRETSILRVVEANGVKISRAKESNCVSAVSALGKVFDRSGDVVLAQVVRTLRTAFNGDPSAFDGAMIEGLGAVFNRYNGLTNEKQMIARLANTPLGVRGVLRRADDTRLRSGTPKLDCVASVIVEVYNRGGGRHMRDRLPSWWKAKQQEERELAETESRKK